MQKNKAEVEAAPRGGKEPRWPGAMAVVAVSVLNWLLPADLSAGPGWLGVLLVSLLAVAAILWEKWHDRLGYAAAALTTFGLGHALWVLVVHLVQHRARPQDLLIAALLLWSMNILVFASWYWRLDEGGPNQRAQAGVYCGGAFLFPQMMLSEETKRAIGAEHWRPGFVDYLFLAFTTSTAFSPTDVPVLSRWAKVMMMVQSSLSLGTLAMVAARAVNIL